MSSRRLFDYDADTKTTTWYEDTNDGFRLYTEQDVADIIELNKAKQNTPDAHKTGHGDWLFASIPNIFVLKFLDEHGVNVYGNKEHVNATFRLLDDPDYRWLKTTEKRHVPKMGARHV